MQGKPHAINLVLDNALCQWSTIRKLCCTSVFSSILASTKLFMTYLNEGTVSGGPNVEQKFFVTDYRCLRCFLWSGEIAQVLQVN